jgi:hypothetical protein
MPKLRNEDKLLQADVANKRQQSRRYKGNHNEKTHDIKNEKP